MPLPPAGDCKQKANSQTTCGHQWATGCRQRAHLDGILLRVPGAALTSDLWSQVGGASQQQEEEGEEA